MSIQVNCRVGHRFRRDALADLSETGLYLKTLDPIEKGVPVRIAVSLPHPKDGTRICTLVGTVTRVDRKGAGIRFSDDEISAADRRALETFLDQRAA